jgi:hypothetical protein
VAITWALVAVAGRASGWKTAIDLGFDFHLATPQPYRD